MTTNGQDRARARKASDVVVSYVRDLIVVGQLPEGERLPSEADLMERFSLGRVTVREALRILERDGLVEPRRGPNGGLFVSHTDIEQVSEALALIFGLRRTTLGEFADFRLQIEPQVARLAAEHASGAQRRDLLASCAVAHPDTGYVYAADFHNLVAKACGNDVYELVVRSMSASLARHFRHELITSRHIDGNHQAHTRIAEHIAAGDATRAEKAMRTHLKHYRAFVFEQNLEGAPIFPLGRVPASSVDGG